jgi:hypothetical protein
MNTSNGDNDEPRGPLELSEVLTIETADGSSLQFEVVGILEDAENEATYAVLRHEDSGGDEDEFIVTDLEGNLVEDEGLAQEVLDDFLAYAHNEDDRSAQNGELG